MLNLEIFQNNNENISLNQAQEKGLADGKSINENYVKIYLAYKNLLEYYLFTRLNLNKYDNALNSCGLTFPSVEKSCMDFYQIFSKHLGNYFFLRNNLYIERLSKEDLLYISNLITSDSMDMEEAMRFIERTYKEIIRENPQELFCYQFSALSGEYVLRDGTIVIGFRYDHFKDANSSDNWESLYLSRKKFVFSLLAEINESLQASGESIVINEYDDNNSIKFSSYINSNIRE